MSPMLVIVGLCMATAILLILLIATVYAGCTEWLDLSRDDLLKGVVLVLILVFALLSTAMAALLVPVGSKGTKVVEPTVPYIGRPTLVEHRRGVLLPHAARNLASLGNNGSLHEGTRGRLNLLRGSL